MEFAGVGLVTVVVAAADVGVEGVAVEGFAFLTIEGLRLRIFLLKAVSF